MRFRRPLFGSCLSVALVLGCQKSPPEPGELTAEAPPIPKSAAPSNTEPYTPPPQEAPSQEQCVQFCELTASLRCDTMAGCLNYCGLLLKDTPCPSELHVFLDCMLDQPAEHFQCSGKNPTTSGDYCRVERAEFSKCLARANTQKPKPSNVPRGKLTRTPPGASHE